MEHHKGTAPGIPMPSSMQNNIQHVLLVLFLFCSFILPGSIGTFSNETELTEHSSRTDPHLDGIKIVIDPGHGLYYKDGAWQYQRPYCWGIVEDELALEIASYLSDYLEVHSEAEVFVTRELDRNAGNGISGHPKWQEGAWCHLRSEMGYTGYGSLNEDLNIRPDYANKVDADLFISIHTNAGGGSARGTMTLWGGQDAGTGGGSPTNDKALADKVHPPVVAECGTNDRGVWKDEDMSGFSLCVLRETNMPAALVEVAFHDNYDDNLLLKEEWFKRAAGRGMLFGIFDYFDVPRPDPELPGVVHELTRVTDAKDDDKCPHLAELSNGHLCVVWERESEENSTIILSSSLDRGMNWEEKEIVTDNIGVVRQPSFTETKDGTFFLIYSRVKNGLKRICYMRSTDGGNIWGPEQELSVFPGNNVTSPRVYRTRYGTLWCVFSVDGNDGGAYFCHSVDNGGSLNSPARISMDNGTVGKIYNTQTAENELWTVWSQRRGDGRWSIFGTSSDSWDGWSEPMELTGDTGFDLHEPTLCETNGSLFLFYSSDRTDDGLDNSDIFFRISGDGGTTWQEECLLSPNTDRDSSPAAFSASDGRVWLTFSSQNGTGGDENIYITNDVRDAGNRAPEVSPITNDSSIFDTLLPKIEFRLFDHDGDGLNGTIFWKESGIPDTTEHAALTSDTEYTFTSPLADATWYEWWITAFDGELNGSSRLLGSSFFVDINYPPHVNLIGPDNGTSFPWNTGEVLFSFTAEDLDRDVLNVTILLANETGYGTDDWKVIHNEPDFRKLDFIANVPVIIPELMPGERYLWMIRVGDENKTETSSPIYSFTVNIAPSNLPPFVEKLKNRTVEIGQVITLDMRNSTDPEGGDLYHEWWIFNVSHVKDPYNASFAFLKENCEHVIFRREAFERTFQQAGRYLVCLNISDEGAYLDPPAITRLRALIHVISGMESDPFTDEILGPDTVGAGIKAAFVANGTWGYAGGDNFTWSIALGGTEITIFSEVLEYTFTKPGDYNITLLVVTVTGNNFSFRKGLTVIPKGEWDAAWNVTILPGDSIRLGGDFHFSVELPSFVENVEKIEWEMGMKKLGVLTGSEGMDGSYVPDSIGEHYLRMVVTGNGFVYRRTYDLVVLEGNGSLYPHDDGEGDELVESGWRTDVYLIVLVISILLGGAVCGFVLVNRARKREGGEGE